MLSLHLLIQASQNRLSWQIAKKIPSLENGPIGARSPRTALHTPTHAPSSRSWLRASVTTSLEAVLSCPPPTPREPAYLHSHHKRGPLSESFPHHEGLLQGNGFVHQQRQELLLQIGGAAPQASTGCAGEGSPWDGYSRMPGQIGGPVWQCHRAQTWGSPRRSHRMEPRGAAPPSTVPARAPAPREPPRFFGSPGPSCSQRRCVCLSRSCRLQGENVITSLLKLRVMTPGSV